jgi:3-hydroxyisobutyrate dehydrogenase-like beta-hydroxyacid dehydrogenase
MSESAAAEQHPSIGLLHPGEMGAAVGGCLVAAGLTVGWASERRSPASRERAERAGLADLGRVSALASASDVLLSICPPGAAEQLARSVRGFAGIYVDANAVSPATAERIAGTIQSGGGIYVDGGIVGPPPGPERPTRLYLSGAAAPGISRLFAGTPVEAPVLAGAPTAASALKMAYAAWTKGSSALLLAVVATAGSHGVLDDLVGEWDHSLPALAERARTAARSAARKGWRWSAEMEEVASTFAAAGQPSGFHLAAAELFGRVPRTDEALTGDALATVVAALRART